MLAENETVVLREEELTVVDATPFVVSVSKRKVPWLALGRQRLSVRRAMAAIGLLLLIGAIAVAYVERKRADAIQGQLNALSSVASQNSDDWQDAGSHSEVRVLGGDSAAMGVATGNSFGHQSDSRTLLKPRMAAELIVQNRLAEALRSYRRLALEPGADPVYSDLVRVLESRLACRRRADESGSPCGD